MSADQSDTITIDDRPGEAMTPATRPVAAPSILARLFGFRRTAPGMPSRFAHWAGPTFLFTGGASLLLALAIVQTGNYIALLTVLPVILLSLAAVLKTYHHRTTEAQRHTRTGPEKTGPENSGVDDSGFEKSVYYTSFGVVLYLGLAGAWLLNSLSEAYLAHLLVWQFGCGFALATLTGTNALQYGTRLSLATLPTLYLLLQTGDQKYMALACLLYLSVCLATLIKLDISEQTRRTMHRQKTLANERDHMAQRLASLIATTDNFLWETGPHHELVYISRVLPRESNRTQVTGATTVNDLTPAHKAMADFLSPARADALLDALKTRKPFTRVQIELPQPEGRTRIFSMSGSPKLTVGGSFGGFSGVAVDITSAVRAREKVSHLTDRLEARVAARTRALKEGLAAAGMERDALQAASQEQARFMNMVLHNLQLLAARQPAASWRQIQRALQSLQLILAFDPVERTAQGSVFGLDDLLRDSVADPILAEVANNVSVDLASFCGEDLYADPGALRTCILETIAVLADLQRDHSDSTGDDKGPGRQPRISIRIIRDQVGLVMSVAGDGSRFPDTLREASRHSAIEIYAGQLPVDGLANALAIRLASALMARIGGTLTLKDSENDEAPHLEIRLHVPRKRLMRRLSA